MHRLLDVADFGLLQQISVGVACGRSHTQTDLCDVALVEPHQVPHEPCCLADQNEQETTRQRVQCAGMPRLRVESLPNRAHRGER